MGRKVEIIGAGLAGSEAALQLAARGVHVRLYEMRPETMTPVHQGGGFAELVCSNSLKGTKPESAAGMLKAELSLAGSFLYDIALEHSVPAGGALAVDRAAFSAEVTRQIEAHPSIEVVREEATSPGTASDACIVAAGPMASDRLAAHIAELTGSQNLAFFDAAAPIAMADTLDFAKLFRQSRYDEAGQGDYWNAPMDRDEYQGFIEALVAAQRVVSKEFETKELFQACQPIEEVARKGADAPRFGALKPVGLVDPRTGRRPWAAVQLRAEDRASSCFNLVGFQTNLRFSEQERVFRMIPGLEEAEFARFGVMHRNTFINAPALLDQGLRLCERGPSSCPLFFAGQISGTEGYCEAIMSGWLAAVNAYALLEGIEVPPLPNTSAFGALMAYATDPATKGYQPMHVNFGILPPLATPLKNKQQRYAAYAERGRRAMESYVAVLAQRGIGHVGKG